MKILYEAEAGTKLRKMHSESPHKSTLPNSSNLPHPPPTSTKSKHRQHSHQNHPNKKLKSRDAVFLELESNLQEITNLSNQSLTQRKAEYEKPTSHSQTHKNPTSKYSKFLSSNQKPNSESSAKPAPALLLNRNKKTQKHLNISIEKEEEDEEDNGELRENGFNAGIDVNERNETNDIEADSDSKLENKLRKKRRLKQIFQNRIQKEGQKQRQNQFSLQNQNYNRNKPPGTHHCGDGNKTRVINQKFDYE